MTQPNQPEKRKKHPNEESPIWGTWINMRQRCNNKNSDRYERYGGRGIEICGRWNDFKTFEKDMLPTYKKGLTIDRIDNDKGYYKENCRWVTRQEQNRNYSRNKKIKIGGEVRLLVEWCEDFDFTRNAVYWRVNNKEETVEEAVTYFVIRDYERRLSQAKAEERELVKYEVIKLLDSNLPTYNQKQSGVYNEGVASGWYAAREFIRTELDQDNQPLP